MLRRVVTSSRTCNRVCINKFGLNLFHTNKQYLQEAEYIGKDRLDKLSEVEFPKKGKVQVPERISKLGDEMLKLNAFESMILSQYVRERLGVDTDIPDPHTAMIKSGFGADLSQMLMGNIGGLGVNPQLLGQLVGGMIQGGMNMQAMGAMGMGAPAQQQQQQAAAPVVEEAAPPAPEEPKVEKTTWDVKLEKYDETKKIALIKELRRIDKNLSIKAAKDLVEGAPSYVMKDANKVDAERLKAEIEAAGGTIVLV
ncbi:rplL [Acrasis kona]|uniref:RplL n=1 Tax=Acrasis kona TaxID=1008807 RepID=A0AAW2ZL57_9EUKA